MLSTPLEMKLPQLLILDLNGTLVCRVKKKAMYVRPYAHVFFDYIFREFTVMVWSSAQPQSVRDMCRAFGSHRSDIDVVWDRRSLNLSETDYHRKVQTVKDLRKVWDHYKGKFNATNTILLDDSIEKARLQPDNAIHLSTFDHRSPEFTQSGEAELLHVMDYLKILRDQSNVAEYMHKHPYDRQHTHPLSRDTAHYRFDSVDDLIAPLESTLL